MPRKPKKKKKFIASGPQARRQAESRAAQARKTPPSKRTAAQKKDLKEYREIFGKN